MNSYPEYRTDGPGWAPVIPIHWTKVRLRRISKIYAGGTPDKTNAAFWTDGDVPWLNSGAVNDRAINSPSAYITREALAASSARWVPAKSVVIALAGQGKTKGMAARLEIRTTCNQSMAAIVPDHRADYRFIQFWLSANYQSIRNLAGGDLRDGLNLQHVGSVEIPLPPLNEQRAIADFLDHETAEIDAFIADQEELVAVLQERRGAVVTNAVTKGLDRTTTSRDSGVDWLGPIPVHWSRERLSRLGIDQQSGTSVNGYGEPAGADEIGVLKTGSASKGYFDPTENKRVTEEDLDRVSCPVRRGSLLVNRANTPDLVGSAAYIDSQHPNLYLSDKLWQINFEDADNRFMYWWMKGPVYRSQLHFYRVGASASMQNLSFADFRGLDIAIPPLDEQRAIAAYLDDATSEIDAAIADAKEAVEVSKERRAALISAAVTGKIDVRNHVAAMGV